MSAMPEKSNAQSYARAHLACDEVRENLVALQRDELSPLRAESVRRHVASCPECREEALDLDLAIRSFSSLGELVPPRELFDLTMAKVLDASPAARSDGESQLWPQPNISTAGTTASPASSPASSPTEAKDLPSSSEPAPERVSVFFKPVTSPLARIAAAAAVLLAVLTFSNTKIAEAVGRAEKSVLSPRVSQALDRASEAVLMALQLLD